MWIKCVFFSVGVIVELLSVQRSLRKWWRLLEMWLWLRFAVQQHTAHSTYTHIFGSGLWMIRHKFGWNSSRVPRSRVYRIRLCIDDRLSMDVVIIALSFLRAFRSRCHCYCCCCWTYIVFLCVCSLFVRISFSIKTKIRSTKYLIVRCPHKCSKSVWCFYFIKIYI